MATIRPKNAEGYPPVSEELELPLIEAEDLAKTIREGDKDVLVVDCRRNDFAGGHVKGAINEPAQSFAERAELLAQSIPQKKVVFYCMSSNGRGPRCAGYYQQALNNLGIKDKKAYVLKGGILKWVKNFSNEDDLTEGYDEDWWKQQSN
ncbi:uncharacterized protein VTP21DRAFT_8568 [Calcarisporiella thermophila]|uniref:uncharacterized protein n=1 Tax=Calcarisporiella thermophila TaxID=911321 RepID=UPI00374211A9